MKLDTLVGSRGAVLALIHDEEVQQAVRAPNTEFTAGSNVWLRPLVIRSSDTVMGVLGIARSDTTGEWNQRERDALVRLAQQAERTLEDRQLQTVIFSALQELRPEIESLQRRLESR